MILIVYIWMIYIYISIYRLSRWIDEEEDKIKDKGEDTLQYVILDMGGKLINCNYC